MSALDRDQLRERVARSRELLEADPQDAIGWLGLARALIELHRLGEAVDALRRVVALDPDQSAAHRDLGRVLLESGDTCGAARCFARAISLAEKAGDVQTGRDIHRFLRSAEKTLPR